MVATSHLNSDCDALLFNKNLIAPAARLKGAL